MHSLYTTIHPCQESSIAHIGMHRWRVTRGISPISRTQSLSSLGRIIGSNLHPSVRSTPTYTTPDKKTHIITLIDIMPPVLTPERILRRLADNIIIAGVARVIHGMLRPGHIHLGMVVVLYTVGIFGVSGVDFFCCEGVLDVSPFEVIVAVVGRKQSPRWSPHVVIISGVDDYDSFPVTATPSIKN